ncbi:MAG: hypothetical protein IJA59_01130 [Clostridia bacterium]|nr:hypothetical protein [Clostridia bacterium]
MRIQFIHIHTVFIKPLQLLLKLQFDKFHRIAKAGLYPEILADRRKERPISYSIRYACGVFRITGCRLNFTQIRPPAICRFAINNAAFFNLPKTADDLPHRKIIGCLDLRNRFAAKLHHLKKDRQ